MQLLKREIIINFIIANPIIKFLRISQLIMIYAREN